MLAAPFFDDSFSLKLLVCVEVSRQAITDENKALAVETQRNKIPPLMLGGTGLMSNDDMVLLCYTASRWSFQEKGERMMTDMNGGAISKKSKPRRPAGLLGVLYPLPAPCGP
jgi:hypothetical protein